ncbi:MAG: hypothetical protein K8S98_08895 [Planctomycetes bacterium]|nr:hypothetical protein [Planctomycetota bacterium]
MCSRVQGVTDSHDGLNDALVDALREMGQSATPEELRAKGVKRVRHVSREMVSKLIEKAVNRTLMERTIGVPDRELRDLVQRAHDEFNRIVGHQDEIDRTREQIGEQRVALKEELVRIRAEIAERREFVEQRRSRERIEVEQEENEQLAARVRECFMKLQTFPPELRRVEREVIIRALETLETARGSALESGRAESGARIQDLERRIAKLVQSLESTEQVLKRVAKMAQSDSGLESIYRTVQGLDGLDPVGDAKKELMRAIFEKNLELYRRTAAAN